MRPSLLVSIMLMVAVMVPAMVHAECPSPERVAEAATVYFANELAAAYTGLTVEDAYCAQRRYVALLERRLGPRGGYKVGFTSRVSQEMSLPGSPILASDTSGRIETGGRLFQLIRIPTSCVTSWLGVADMWHVAHVGTAS